MTRPADAGLKSVRETITVELFGSLAVHAGGLRHVEVEAATMGEMLSALGDKYPGMKPQLERGVSVSIDGRIYTESLFEPVRAAHEIVLLAQLRGG